MAPLGLSAYAVTKVVGSTPVTIPMITCGKRATSTKMALRLGRYIGTSAGFWMNLQANYSLRVARARKAAETGQYFCESCGFFVDSISKSNSLQMLPPAALLFPKVPPRPDEPPAGKARTRPSPFRTQREPA